MFSNKKKMEQNNLIVIREAKQNANNQLINQSVRREAYQQVCTINNNDG